jgi:hypothetical protein
MLGSRKRVTMDDDQTPLLATSCRSFSLCGVAHCASNSTLRPANESPALHLASRSRINIDAWYSYFSFSITVMD